MSSIGTGYDLSASQFSPDGRVFQVEYAMKATENSGTAIGICGKDGVVFAVEKLSPNKLHENTANKRLFNVDFHIGACIAGFIPDGETLVRSAMSECASHRDAYGESIQLQRLTDRLAQLMHCYTLYSSVRPLGVSVMFSSWSKEEGPQLYMMDPAGICYGYYGCAIGKGKQNAKTEIEKLKMKTMTIQELIKEAARIIFVVHDEVKDKSFELNLSWVGKSTGGKHMMVPPDVYQDAVVYAKTAMEESDESEEDI